MWNPRSARQLRQLGYTVLQAWRPGWTTEEIGRSIGEVVEISKLLQGVVPTVQTLRPRRKESSPPNQYSGAFGLGEFPLHSDLAHWAVPPRYLLLRCKVGAKNVRTHIVPTSDLIKSVPDTTIRRAVLQPRRQPPCGAATVLSFQFLAKGAWGYRWDSLFLKAMNKAAEDISAVMAQRPLSTRSLVSFALATPGDTLVVDNWRSLHGRDKVSEPEVNRAIERLYLSEIYQ